MVERGGGQQPAVSMTKRDDGREDLQLRPMSSEQGLINQADGSSRFAHGGAIGSSVLVSVQGPVGAFGARGETQGLIEVICKPDSGKAGPEHVECAQVVKGALEAMAILTQIPRTITTVVIQMVHNDGGFLAAAINGACLAFLDAGIPMNGLVTATTCALVGPGHWIVDPTKDEEKGALAVLTTAWQNNSPGVITSFTNGIMSEDDYVSGLDTGHA